MNTKRSQSLIAYWRKLHADPERLKQREEKRIKSFKQTYANRRLHGILTRAGHLH